MYIYAIYNTDIKQLKRKADGVITALPFYMQSIGCEDAFKTPKFSTNEQNIIDCGFVYFEDGEYIPNIKSIYEELKDKLKINQSVQESGTISCFTTSSVISDTFDAEDLLNNSVKWFDWFYDLDTKTIIDLVNTSSTGIVHVYKSYTDLGLGEEWYTNMIKIMNNYWSSIRREVLLKRKDKE